MTLLVTVARGVIDVTHLAPAQGCQDHTTWPPAARIDREALKKRPMRQRPSHPAPRVVTIARNAPLLGTRCADNAQ